MPIHADRDRWGRIFHCHFRKVKGNVVRHPTIRIGVIAASAGNRERNPFPPTVKAVQVRALKRTRKSPKVEPNRNKEKENISFEMTRKTPKKPTSIPISFLIVIASWRKRRAEMVIKMGITATIQPVLMAVV
jgi:hypothetical protein